MKIIVAGIHTEVGKTVVSAILVEALGGTYWKPVQCGLPADSEWVESHLSSKGRCHPSTFVLKTPCSPHRAAEIEGKRIEAKKLRLPAHSGVLVIEGTGGILAPLNEKESWADAALHWGAVWLLVHRHYLGSLNHFLLTLEVLRHRNIPLWGVVFNGEGDLGAEEMLLARANSLWHGRVGWNEPILEVAKRWKNILG